MLWTFGIDKSCRKGFLRFAGMPRQTSSHWLQPVWGIRYRRLHHNCVKMDIRLLRPMSWQVCKDRGGEYVWVMIPRYSKSCNNSERVLGWFSKSQWQLSCGVFRHATTKDLAHYGRPLHWWCVHAWLIDAIYMISLHIHPCSRLRPATPVSIRCLGLFDHIITVLLNSADQVLTICHVQGLLLPKMKRTCLLKSIIAPAFTIVSLSVFHVGTSLLQGVFSIYSLPIFFQPRYYSDLQQYDRFSIPPSFSWFSLCLNFAKIETAISIRGIHGSILAREILKNSKRICGRFEVLFPTNPHK